MSHVIWDGDVVIWQNFRLWLHWDFQCSLRRKFRQNDIFVSAYIYPQKCVHSSRTIVPGCDLMRGQFHYNPPPVKMQTFQWRHNERHCVSNHRHLDCLFSCLFRSHQRRHQSSVSLVVLRGIHRRPVDSPHKGPVTRKMFLFDYVIMYTNAPVPVKLSWKIWVNNSHKFIRNFNIHKINKSQQAKWISYGLYRK